MIWSNRSKLQKHLNTVHTWWTENLDPKKLMEWEEDAHAKRGVVRSLLKKKFLGNVKLGITTSHGPCVALRELRKKQEMNK